MSKKWHKSCNTISQQRKTSVEDRRQKNRLRKKTFAKWLKTKTKKKTKDKSRIKSAPSYAGRTKKNKTEKLFQSPSARESDNYK